MGILVRAMGKMVFYGYPSPRSENQIMPERITLTRDGPVAHVRLDRPEVHNALDLPMFRAIVDVQKQLARDRELRAVILDGAGVDFCSGLDVKSIMQDRSGILRLLWKWRPGRSNLAQRVSTGWRTLPVPVIAAIHGRCWGGGLQIALGADLRVVHPEASLSVMEGRWGLIPDMGGNLALRELVGADHALWLALSADVVDARRAVEIGLASMLAEDPHAEARRLCETVCERSPDAVAAIKRLFRSEWSSRPRRLLARETGYQARVLLGPNQRIAVRRQQGDQKPYLPRGRW
jgi:enoyl-CoA hydratase/carnithine racemase